MGVQTIVDPLYLSNFDIPRMLIGNVIFDRTNFLAWNQSISLVFRVKLKLGSIDRTVLEPEVNSIDYVNG